MTNQELVAEILKRRTQADRGCRAWSAAFHLTFGISTVTGIIVAAIAEKEIKIFSINLPDYIPLIALSGSILSAVGIFGGFERKWKANRITRNELDVLILKISAGENPSKEVEEYIDIVRTHDAAIINDSFKSEKSVARSNRQPRSPNLQPPPGVR